MSWIKQSVSLVSYFVVNPVLWICCSSIFPYSAKKMLIVWCFLGRDVLVNLLFLQPEYIFDIVNICIFNCKVQIRWQWGRVDAYQASDLSICVAYQASDLSVCVVWKLSIPQCSCKMHNGLKERKYFYFSNYWDWVLATLPPRNHWAQCGEFLCMITYSKTPKLQLDWLIDSNTLN